MIDSLVAAPSGSHLLYSFSFVLGSVALFFRTHSTALLEWVGPGGFRDTPTTFFDLQQPRANEDGYGGEA
jgi:hypothetical protein